MQRIDQTGPNAEAAATSEIQSLLLELRNANTTIAHLNRVITELDNRFTDLLEVFKSAQNGTITPEECEKIRKQYLDTRHLEKKVVALELKLATQEHSNGPKNRCEPISPSPSTETFMHQLKEEIIAERAIVRSTIDRADRLSSMLENQKLQLSLHKKKLVMQEEEITKLKDKISGQVKKTPLTMSPVKVAPVPMTPLKVSKEEPTGRVTPVPQLPRSNSASSIFQKIIKGSPRGSEIIQKPKPVAPVTSSPRKVHFADEAPRRESNADIKGKMHAVDEKPITKFVIDRNFSQAKSTGRSCYKTLDKTNIKTPQYLNVQHLVKRNLTK